MSSVTKPIILDETGQAIVNKLDDIVDAIGEIEGGGGGASTLGDLTDVTLTNPASGNILKYNSSLGVWKNGKNPEINFTSIQDNGAWENIPYDTLPNAMDEWWGRVKTQISYITNYTNTFILDGYCGIVCDSSANDYSSKLSKIEGLYKVSFIGNNQCSPSGVNYFSTNLLLTPIINDNINPFKANNELISQIYIYNFGTQYAMYHIMGSDSQESSDITTSTTGIYVRSARFNILERKSGDA